MRTRNSSTGFRHAIIVGLMALAVGGCSDGEKLNPVKGKVMYNGQPLAGALVSFHPKGNPDMKVENPTGLTTADGTFTLTTGQKEGAREGEYVVTIICSVVPKQEGSKKGPKSFGTGDVETVDLLGGAYANRENSKFNVTIKSGNNELEVFNLN